VGKQNIDVLIYGGGIAGLWILDELRRAGVDAILLEKTALGDGQTVASQGIIHGGLKYMFDGNITAPVKAIAEMPVIWRECLAGKREPDLSGTTIRSECCWLWGTGSIKSRIFMAGSTIALRAAPEAVERKDWPDALLEVKGKVMKVGEAVIDPVSLMGTFAKRNRGRVFRSGGFNAQAKYTILAAGEGNAQLRKELGLSENVMQRRPATHGDGESEVAGVVRPLRGGSQAEDYGDQCSGFRWTNCLANRRTNCGGWVKMDVPQLVKHAAAEIRNAFRHRSFGCRAFDVSHRSGRGGDGERAAAR